MYFKRGSVAIQLGAEERISNLDEEAPQFQNFSVGWKWVIFVKVIHLSMRGDLKGEGLVIWVAGVYYSFLMEVKGKACV